MQSLRGAPTWLKDICNVLSPPLPSLVSLLEKELDEKGWILDVGCGQSSPLSVVKKGSYRVGLDSFMPFILLSKKRSIHDDYILADARHLPFRSKSFDYAVATEVLEHSNKHDGHRMIRQIEEIAAKIILTIPNGFFRVYPGPDALNPMERHLSGWTVSELEMLGFRVYGLSGLRFLWKAVPGKLVIKFKPQILFAYISRISQLLVFHHPSLAFQLFCIKSTKN